MPKHSGDSARQKRLTIADTQLTILYTPGAKLLVLINTYSPGKPDKIVFQFYCDSDGNISLAGFVGQKVTDTTNGNRKTVFNTSNPLLLKDSSEVPYDCDISGLDVLFSNQELNIKDENYAAANDISILSTFLIANPSVFITFTPSLIGINSDTVYEISYKIGYTEHEPTPGHSGLLIHPIQNLATNPTPPRNSY